jgi:hypothetical protein
MNGMTTAIVVSSWGDALGGLVLL